MRAIPIVLFGVGGVGREVVRILATKRCELGKKYNADVQLIALIDSTAAVMARDTSLSPTTVKILLKEKTRGNSFRSVENHQDGFRILLNEERDGRFFTHILLNELKNIPGCVFVDCTADDGMVDTLITTLEHNESWSVVLANKKPMTNSMEKYRKLTADLKRIRYESTVGAGLPIITALTRIVSSGDDVRLIEGAFSGTLGYLCSALEGTKTFSQSVRDAKKLGYTEPDPREDLSGMDVARKALILARTCGATIEMNEIEVESLVPHQLQGLRVEEFLTGLEDADDEFATKVRLAKEKGNVLRYCARIVSEKNHVKVKVGMTEVSRERSPLGRLQGSDNLISIASEVYDVSPLVIQGRGAGVSVTAAGVVSDIVDLTFHGFS